MRLPTIAATAAIITNEIVFLFMLNFLCVTALLLHVCIITVFLLFLQFSKTLNANLFHNFAIDHFGITVRIGFNHIGLSTTTCYAEH